MDIDAENSIRDVFIWFDRMKLIRAHEEGCKDIIYEYNRELWIIKQWQIIESIK